MEGTPIRNINQTPDKRLESSTLCDCDNFVAEINEIYAYSEEPEFAGNRNSFEEFMEDLGLPLAWIHMVKEQRWRAVNHLISNLDISCRITRIKSCRALIYLLQGNFAECDTIEEQVLMSQKNAYLLCEQNLFNLLVQQLLLEANIRRPCQQLIDSMDISPTQIFSDSLEMRLILSGLITIAEVMNNTKDTTDPKLKEIREQFVLDLKGTYGDEILPVILFRMLNSFCNGSAPHFPIKKISLLLWKVLLITLGGFKELIDMKREYRKAANLKPEVQETAHVVRYLEPREPPLSAPVKKDGRFMMTRRKMLKQQDALDEMIALIDNEINDDDNIINADELESDDGTNFEIDLLNDSQSGPMKEAIKSDVEPGIEDGSEEYDSGNVMDSSNSSSDDDLFHLDKIYDESKSKEDDDDKVKFLQAFYSSKRSRKDYRPIKRPIYEKKNIHLTEVQKKGLLPWIPKVYTRDLTNHVTQVRQKFMGYSMYEDNESLFGFPPAYVEGVNILKRYLYTPLSEAQLRREELIDKYPYTHDELIPATSDSPAEKLYCALLPRLPQYMIALLKILLASTTETRERAERSDSINVMHEMNPEDDNTPLTIIQTIRIKTDCARHREIIIKSISAILLLLLKHFKINHVYQFEYISQQLMFANCIPLILKYLSQDLHAKIQSPSSRISVFEFPNCVIGEQPEFSTQILNVYLKNDYPSWRNKFSTINLLRILNKLVKRKSSRIMLLVVFKSSQTLMNALNVRDSMMQLYVLKLLQYQLKFLGRPWRKNNMRLVACIYAMVRHRLVDDWAYSCDNDAKPWDFQAEEYALQSSIYKFHQRRYHHILSAASNMSGAHVRAEMNNQVGNTKARALANVHHNAIDRSSMSSSTCSPPSSLHHNHSYYSKSNGFIYDLDLLELDSEDTVPGLNENFERNYEKWLENEVFQRKINWDMLLT